MKKILSSHCAVGFAIGAMLFGSLVGPSMISGVFSKAYFVGYGMWGFVFIIFFPLIVGLIHVFSAQLVRYKKVYDYNSFMKALFRKTSPVMTPITEVYMLMSQILTLAAVVSMGGTMCNTLFGWAPLFGQLLFGVGCGLIIMKGAGVVRKSSTIMCFLLIGLFAFLAIYATYIKIDEFRFMVDTWYVPDGVNVQLGLQAAIMWGFSGVINGMVHCAAMQKVQTRADAIWAGVWTFLLPLLVLFIEVLLVLPYCPEAMQAELPTMYIISEHLIENLPWLPTLYYIIMLMALVTSGVPCMHSMVSRMCTLVPKKGIFTNKTFTRFLMAIIFLGVVLLISQVGLMAIVTTGYTWLGKIGVFLIFVPTCIISPIMLHREYTKAGIKNLNGPIDKVVIAGEIYNAEDVDWTKVSRGRMHDTVQAEGFNKAAINAGNASELGTKDAEAFINEQKKD